MTKEWYYKGKNVVRPVLTYDEVLTIIDALKRTNTDDKKLYTKLYTLKAKMELKNETI